jgi:glycosyltransferase involved in cell wall biosynthesis
VNGLVRSLTLDRTAETLLSVPDRGDKPKHVLFLIDRFPQKMGGAEGTLLTITRLLPPSRYRCSVVTFAIDSNFEDIRSLFSCPLFVWPLQRTYGWGALKVAAKIGHLIRSQEVSVVHTFFSTSDLWGGVIAKLSGCPVLISSRRDMGLDRSPKHRVAYRLLRSMFDQVQAVSERVRSFSIAEDGISRSRVVLLHNGVDLHEMDRADVFAPSETDLGLQGASHFITSVGNIRPVKGTDILIRTASRVCKRFPTAVFLVVGRANDPAYFSAVQQLAESLDLTQNVRFLGLRNNVPSILKLSDVFVLPSRSEGLSNALLEAMACRLPCVVTDVGGNAEVVEDGKSGFVVPSENPEIAAERIIRLLENRPLARDMGKAARKTIEDKFTAQVMVDRLVTYYDDLTERKAELRYRGASATIPKHVR